MVFNFLLKNGLFFGAVSTGYLFLIMVAFSPRVWGYTDFPEAIKRKIPPQTRKEKLLAAAIGLPWLAFVFAFPVYATYQLKSNLGNEIPFLTAFLSLFALYAFAALGDLVILDWLIVSTITPPFVMIQGTEWGDYKDFSYHYRGHLKATLGLIPVFLFIAALLSFL